MSDPYSVLGVLPSATDAEIKKAFKKLSRKYHPDMNPDDPSANEKFQEINAAYQQIMDERKNGGRQTSYGYGGFSGERSASNSYTNEDDIHLQAAVNFIQNGRFQEALNVLNGISDRNAQWYYVHAVADMGMNNKSAAQTNADTAAQMEPNNTEYRRFAEALRNGGFQNGYGTYGGYYNTDNSGWYRQQQQGYGYNNNLDSDWCARMCCYNILCNLLCGGCCTGY